jgi:Asp-tRNA(Asn)/Glu-tRNA(Gln) amidotransferase A subunit family amidase
MKSLIDLMAVEARDRIAKGDITAEAYTKACLDQIAARDKDVDAWAHLDPAYALEQARALDKHRASGKPLGLLHGLTVGIKDIIDTKDMPTAHNCPIFKGRQPEKDATCVAQLRAAGAVILGKTVTTELANTNPSKTKNPHNKEHTPGGSSAGSAAGMGAKMFPLALGTQTGGSVIRPASFNGVHALKPTLGLISRAGVLLQSHTLDTVGVYGRSLADLALATDAISAHDPGDPVSYVRGRGGLSAALASGLAIKPTFAFFRSPAWTAAEPAAKAGIEKFVAALGAIAKDVEIPAMDDIVQHHANVMGAENDAYYGPLLARHPEGISANLTGRLQAGAKVTGGDYVRSRNARHAAYAGIEAVLDQHSAILTLSSCGPAPKGFATTGNAIFNGMWTLLGVPCVSLPLMTVDGMPCGVQLVGKRRDEARLLQVARWLEQRVAT